MNDLVLESGCRGILIKVLKKNWELYDVSAMTVFALLCTAMCMWGGRRSE
jgi:hypothetical protein